MLSRKQFLDKHRVKFQGLSQADKTKRYNDYVSQFGSNQKKEPVRQRQMTRAHEAGMKRSVGMSNIKFSNYSQFRKMKKDMVEQYIRSVLNPWEFKAHMPDPLSYRGVPVSIKYQDVLQGDGRGNLVSLVRPGYGRHVAYSANADCAPDASMPFGYGGFVPIAANSDAFRLQQSTDPASGSFLDNNMLSDTNSVVANIISSHSGLTGINTSPWQSIPTYSDVTSTAVAYRVVSGGVRYTYIGPPLSASGTLVAAPYHAGYGLPVTDASALTFQKVAALQGAETCAAVDGLSAIMLPYSSAPSEFRPTKCSYPAISSAGPTFLAWGASTFQDFAPCDIDPDAYKGCLGNGLFNSGVAVDDGAIFYDSANAAQLQVNEYAVGTPAVSTFAGLFAASGVFQDNTLPSDLTSVVIFGSGLEKSNPATDGIELFRAEYVLNIELIPDSRAFSAVSVESSTGLASSISHPIDQVAKSFAAKLPPIHPGNRIPGEHVAAALNKVASELPQILQKGGKVLKIAGKAAGGTMSVAEIASAVAEIGELLLL